MSEAGKYYKPILKYIKSKGLYLFVIAFIPSLLTAFLISPSSMLYLLCNYFNIGTFDFPNVFLKMLNFDSQFFYIGIIGIALYIFVIAILFGTIDRHMRIGEFTISFHRAKTRIDYNLFTALKLTIAVVVGFALYNILNVLFIIMWAKAFESFTLALIFSILTFLILSFLLIMTFSMLLLWPPFMLHTGLSSFEAFKMALRQNSKNMFKVSLILALAALPFVFVMLLNAFLGWGNWISILLDGLCLAYLTVVYTVTMYTIFYDVTGIERLDLQIVDIWKKRKGV